MQADGANNVIFHLSLWTCKEQVPGGELEGGVAFPSGLQDFVSLSRTMDIIYTSLLDVNHKEVSPQTSFRLSHCLWLRLKATATLHLLLPRTFLHGHQQPTEGHWRLSGILPGRHHRRPTLSQWVLAVQVGTLQQDLRVLKCPALGREEQNPARAHSDCAAPECWIPEGPTWQHAPWW